VGKIRLRSEDADNWLVRQKRPAYSLERKTSGHGILQSKGMGMLGPPYCTNIPVFSSAYLEIQVLKRNRMQAGQ
jgi:hypothetical protein